MKDWPFFETEGTVLRAVDIGTGEIRRQQIRRELQAVEIGVDQARQRSDPGTKRPKPRLLGLLRSRPDPVRARPVAWDRTRALARLLAVNGGEGGIRTRGAVSDTRAFQARTFGHSDTSP